MASTEPDTIRGWFRRWPEARLGLLCGKANGISVLDVDECHGKGASGGATLRDRYGIDDPTSLTPVWARTPRGGLHLFFKHDPRLKNTAGVIGPGLDVRTTGGFVLAPGSYKDDKCYLPGGAPLGTVELPAWPENLVPAPKPEYQPPEIVAEASEEQKTWAAEKLAVKACEVAKAPEGQRHVTLNDAAFLAGGLGAHGFLSFDAAREALVPAGLACGLPEREAGKTFEDGWRDGLARPISEFPRDWGEWLVANCEDLPPLSDLPIEKTGAKPRLRFLTIDEAEAEPAREYLVKGLISRGDVASIYGAPGAGKSCLAPYLGYAIAQGREVFGLRVRQGLVFYAAAEDSAGMRDRAKALRQRYGDTSNFVLVEGLTDLLRDLTELVAAVEDRKPELVIIDTLAAAHPGLSENDSAEMGRVVENARKLAANGAAVILIHHDTKSQGPTPRGHSILNGALDMGLQLFPADESGIVRGKLSKNRSGPCTLDIAFTIMAAEVGIDSDGDPRTAATIEELVAGAVGTRKPKLSPSEAAALDLLRSLVSDSDRATEAAWKAECVAGNMVSASDKKGSRDTAFMRAYRGLRSKGRVYGVDGWVYLVDAHCAAGNGFEDQMDDSTVDLIG